MYTPPALRHVVLTITGFAMIAVAAYLYEVTGEGLCFLGTMYGGLLAGWNLTNAHHYLTGRIW